MKVISELITLETNSISKSETLNNYKYLFHLYEIDIKDLTYFYLMNNYHKYVLYLNSNQKKSNFEEHIFKAIKSNKNPPFDLNNLTIKYEPISDNLLWGNKITSKSFEEYKFEYKDIYCLNKYYEDNNISIILVHGILQNYKLFDYLFNSTYNYILISFPWYLNKADFQSTINLIKDKRKDKKNEFIMLCPDLDSILFSIEFDLKYLFINNNAWLDYEIFTYKKSNKIYNMIMNCRSQPSKRPYLAKNVDNLAFIKSKNLVFGDSYDFNELKYSFTNNKSLSAEEICTLCNQSHCGGIFSAIEGCCYASVEYLLCGLPVISTPSQGGRDIWYNTDNSIIVENEDDIQNAIQNIVNGSIKFDNAKISKDCKELIIDMRNRFNDYIQTIFDRHKIDINASEYLSKNYFHKLKRWHNFEDSIISMKSSKVQLHDNVILDILNTIKNKNQPIKMLVFGLGHDSLIWNNYVKYINNKSITIFVEDDDYYIKKQKSIDNNNIIKFKYSTTVKETLKHLKSKSSKDIKEYIKNNKFQIPEKLLKYYPFDIILIDGPKGYDNNQSGRLLPIYWYEKYLSNKNTVIYVDDSNRTLESLLIDKYFGLYEITKFNERSGTVRINKL